MENFVIEFNVHKDKFIDMGVISRRVYLKSSLSRQELYVKIRDVVDSLNEG